MHTTRQKPFLGSLQSDIVIMKIRLTILMLSQALVGAQTLSISAMRPLPQFIQKPILETVNAAEHVHPIFDVGDLNGDGLMDLMVFYMDGPDVPPPGGKAA